jgi:signal transduction histidine kinase
VRTRNDPLPIPQTNLANSIAIVALGLLTWGVLSYARQHDTGAALTAALVLLGVSAVAWLAWVLVRGSVGWTTGPVLIILSLAGGALSAFAPTAMVFCGVAMLGAALIWPIRVAALVGAGGWLAMFVSVGASGATYAIAVGGLAAILAGAIIGISRRLTVERTQQAARMEVQTARAEVERARAELLGERNHLAREIHDVLAHTLAALSLQLEAFGTVVDSEPGTSSAVREQLEKTRRLVHEGLDEARGAVQALRDDAAPLGEQLAKLAARHGADFTTTGAVRPLPPPVVMGLYRVAQEALTNVMKHAPGARTSVHLGFDAGRVSLTVDNAAATDGRAAIAFLAASGGGYGLRGIAERLALLGGQVEAGPTPDGWRVAAKVPLALDTTAVPAPAPPSAPPSASSAPPSAASSAPPSAPPSARQAAPDPADHEVAT